MTKQEFIELFEVVQSTTNRVGSWEKGYKGDTIVKWIN
jgi:hypothetical protein